MTDEAVSPLRRRMIEDMTIRQFAPKTQHDYVQRVTDFAAFLGRSPDTATRGRAALPASPGGERRWRADPQPAVSTLRFFFRVTLERHGIVEQTHSFRSRASCRWCSVPRRWRGCSMPHPGLKYKAALSVAYGAACASRRDRAQGRRHRQRAHADPRRAGQGPQGPLRHALAEPARPAAHLVEGGAAAGLAVPGPRSGAADHDAPAQPRLSCRRPDGGDRQAGLACTRCGTASPPICWSRTSISA